MRTLRVTPQTPVVTYAVMLVCLVIPPLSMAPRLTGGLVFVPVYALGEPYRMLTAGFVHAGFLHLLCNLLVLAIAGRSLERALGRWRYCCFYLLATTSAYTVNYALALFTPLSNPVIVTVGASGGVFALFMANLVIQRHFGGETTGLAILLAIQMGDSFVRTGISWEVHLGGIIAGALLTSGLVGIASMTRRLAITRGPAAVRQLRTLASIGLFAAVAAIDVAVWAAGLRLVS